MKLPPGMLALLKRHETGLMIMVVVVAVATAIFDTQHDYWYNPAGSSQEIARQTARLGIIALGAAVVIIAGGIDLSCGAVVSFCGSACAATIYLLARQQIDNYEPVPLWVIWSSVGASTLAALLIGCLHGWLITAIRLPPFVATLATLVGLRSAARVLIELVTEGNSQISISDHRFHDATRSITNQVLLFGLLAIVTWILMRWTVTGRHLYALGGNEAAARLSGIRTNRLKYLAYVWSAVLAGFAGILYIGDQGVAEPKSLGQGFELNAIAAAVVGGCSLQGGAGTIPGVVLGALVLRMVVNGINYVIKRNADVYEGLIVGAAVVITVAYTQWRSKRRSG